MTRSKSTQIQSTSTPREELNPIAKKNLAPIAPVLRRIGFGPRNARVTIEVNQFKYTDVLLTSMHMANLTKEDLAEAIRAYWTRNQPPPEPEQAKNSEGSGNSHRSRDSVFDCIGDKGKGPQKKTTHKAQNENRDDEAEKIKKLAKLRDKIRQEEHAKLELKVQKRIREEKDKILRKSRSKRTHRDIGPEIISD